MQAGEGENKTKEEVDNDALRSLNASNMTTIAIQAEEMKRQKMLNFELRQKITRLEMRIIDMGDKDLVNTVTDESPYFRLVKVEQMLENLTSIVEKCVLGKTDLGQQRGSEESSAKSCKSGKTDLGQLPAKNSKSGGPAPKQ